MRGIKVRTKHGMVALSGEEAAALRDLLAQSPSAHSAGETLAVSANASTSITFTETEKCAVLDVLTRLLGPENKTESPGLQALKTALEHDLEAP